MSEVGTSESCTRLKLRRGHRLARVVAFPGLKVETWGTGVIYLGGSNLKPSGPSSCTGFPAESFAGGIDHFFT